MFRQRGLGVRAKTFKWTIDVWCRYWDKNPIKDPIPGVLILIQNNEKSTFSDLHAQSIIKELVEHHLIVLSQKASHSIQLNLIIEFCRMSS